MKFIERENEVIETIKKLSNFKTVVVGGYGVSARAKHRFSVDCDLVVSKKDLKGINAVLTKQGYKKLMDKKDFDKQYAGEFIRYVKKVDNLPVSIDLLVGSLVCRVTNASWSFNYILENSDKAIITGIEGSVECLVPTKELLLAFKIHSGRKTDLRDVIVLKGADWSVVKNNINRGNLDVLRKQIRSMIEQLNNKNIVNSLKGTFQLKQDVEKTIQDTERRLTNLLGEL